MWFVRGQTTRILAALLSSGLLGAAGVQWASTAPAAAAEVVVQPGDSLTSLAQEYGVTPVQLAEANDLTDPNYIQAGQVLQVPSPSPAVEASDAQAANPAGASREVTIEAGDTLTSVAARYGVTLAQLVAANDITDPNFVEAGTTIVIPSVSSRLSQDGGPGPALLGSPYGQELLADFQQWGTAFGVPPNLLEGLTWWESGWNNSEVSSTGALGIGQLEPGTVGFVQTYLLDDPGLNPTDPDQNIEMTAAFLGYLIGRAGGDRSLAVAGYYQGLSSVESVGLYEDTRHYVAGVLAYANLFAGT